MFADAVLGWDDRYVVMNFRGFFLLLDRQGNLLWQKDDLPIAEVNAFNCALLDDCFLAISAGWHEYNQLYQISYEGELMRQSLSFRSYIY
jgi:hypothetical protein